MTVTRARLDVLFYNGAATVASGNIVTGSFSSVSVSGGGGTAIVFGLGTDTKNEDLLAFYGFAPNTPATFANTQIALGSCSSVGATDFSCTVQTADLINSLPDGASDVPIPAAAWLFGSALSGLLLVSRRKKA